MAWQGDLWSASGCVDVGFSTNMITRPEPVFLPWRKKHPACTQMLSVTDRERLVKDNFFIFQPTSFEMSPVLSESAAAISSKTGFKVKTPAVWHEKCLTTLCKKPLRRCLLNHINPICWPEKSENPLAKATRFYLLKPFWHYFDAIKDWDMRKKRGNVLGQ